jgi:hypothetical protein
VNITGFKRQFCIASERQRIKLKQKVSAALEICVKHTHIKIAERNFYVETLKGKT